MRYAHLRNMMAAVAVCMAYAASAQPPPAMPPVGTMPATTAPPAAPDAAPPLVWETPALGGPMIAPFADVPQREMPAVDMPPLVPPAPLMATPGVVMPGPGPDGVVLPPRPPEAVDFGDFGGRGGDLLGGGMHPADSFRYATTWFPTVPLRNQPGDFQMLAQDLSFSHPLWVDPRNALSLTAGVRNRLIDSDAILPDTGQPVPDDLWNVQLGLRYARQLNDGWITGGGVSVGSASDHPFAGIREMNVGMNAMVRIPQGEHNAWMFSLMYSPTGELNFPVPGVAFSYNPSPQFHANIGLPLMVMWRPDDVWQFQASYMLLRTVHCKATCRLGSRLSAFAAYDWANEAYMLLDRPETDDRFFLYDQRVSLGLQWLAFRHWTAATSAGYAFDRYMYEGTSASGGGSNHIDLGAGPFLMLNLGARY
jgi:hypothetical protein